MANYGPPPGPPTAPRPSASPEQRAKILGYSAAGLGALAFIWGFLDWVGVGGAGTAGFSTSGTAAIACLVLAGAVAMADVLDAKAPSVLPVAFAVTGLLVTFGVMISLPAGLDVSVGLILTLITAIAQVAVLGFGWLKATGRLPAPQPPNAWQQQPYGGPPPQQGPPPGYSPPIQQPPYGGPPQQQGPPPGYGPPH